MVPVAEGATDYKQAFNDVSIAYVGSAKLIAECNIRSNAAKELQRKNTERYEGVVDGNSKP